jgi:sterol desaturase/sphingolipid hydroxylase (fatty acid hydroxylase superfamily)
MDIENWFMKWNEVGDFNLFIFFLFENLSLIVLSVLVGKIIESKNTVLLKKDVKWILCTLLFNTIVTFFGFKLFYLGYIKFIYENSFLSIMVDLFLITIVMDLLMFVFHYFIHKIDWLFVIHKKHHSHIHTNVYSLYVLHPIEVIGFGSLWLITIWSMNFNFYSVVIYLFLNLTYGVLGHMKRDVFPNFWTNNFLTKWISTTRFHNQHHLHLDHNYGFYFTFWDKIFKTYIDDKKTPN